MSLLLRFNQLRNSMWSSCPARLLMPHAGLSLGKLLDPKSYERRLFSTSVQDTASLHSASLGSCISGIQPLKFQQTSEPEPSVPLLIFDIETTGYFQKITGNVQKGNRITEFAVRDLCGGKNSTFETLLNPERDVPEYLATVNNINTDLVCRPDVPRFSDVLPLLLAFARSRQTPGKPVIWVAHNVKRFDGPFLAQEFDRCSAQIPEDWLFVDTYCVARKLPKLLPSEDKKHLLNLESLCKRYEISVEGPSHRAMQDVMALCHVFQKMSFDLQLTHEGLMNEAINASYFSKYLN
ncbi:exonuclease DPD1, chloroplastic/mitochondrial-like [Triticum dicoccoides]|uniref:exonuclease DPD1, chloroplastic/mitochondrial-like n=1 Tax=Triticum dicoccoides TaxID=85692 RepID=UPI000E7C4E04|nr:exonuclease DPD1, chloroplastic/mitochondrial-like [Triticum dicoccoides]